MLRPGGRLCVSDLTVERDDLPPEIATQPAAWAGCVAGALAEEGFLHKLDRAGFQRAEVVYRAPLSIDDCALYPLFSDEVIRLMRTLIPVEHHAQVAVAVVVKAQLPEVPAVRPNPLRWLAKLWWQGMSALAETLPRLADIASVEVRHLTHVEPGVEGHRHRAGTQALVAT